MIGLLLALSIAACGPSPEEMARLAYEAAVAAEEEGDLGASERILVELLDGGAPASEAQAQALLADIRVRQEEVVIQTVREIHRAQADFLARERRYAQFFDALVEGALLAANPQDLNVGWSLRMRPSPAADSYTLTAEPDLATPDKRFFFSDETGAIRWEPGRSATADSPELTER